jgi:nucleoside-diphosphate-sugar epimerase
MVELRNRDEALGRAWHVPNAETPSTRGFLELLFEQIGKPPKMSDANPPMMALAGLFISGAREMVEMMYEFEKPFAVDSTRFEKAFELRATPLAESIRATVDWYRKHLAGA